MTTRTITLEVDELDEEAILKAVAVYQRLNRFEDGSGVIVPEGESDLRGLILGEICRGYREAHGEWKHDKT